MPRQRVLIIGVGSIGERHVRCFQATQRAQLAICEIDRALRERVAGQYQVERTYEQTDAALQDRHDAVVICTPAHLHVPLARQFAEAGSHLLIEKPLSTSLEGVAELRQLVDRQQLACAVAYVTRAHPALAAMRQALGAGRFGAPLQIVACSGQHFPTYRPAYRDIYYRDRATGGGAIQDALTHMLDAAQWLVGPVDRVAADAAHLALPGVDVEDTVHVIARHGDVLGSYTLNQHQAPNETSLTVVCQRGTVRFEGHRARWRWLNEAGGTWHDEAVGPLERDDLFVVQAHRFLDTLDGRAPPLCSLDDGIAALRAVLAVLAASESRRWVDVGK